MDEPNAQRRGGAAGAVPLLRQGEPACGQAAEPAWARSAAAPGTGAAAPRGQARPGGPHVEAVSVPKLPGDDDGGADGASDPAAVQCRSNGAGAVPMGSGQAEGSGGLPAGEFLAPPGGTGPQGVAPAGALGPWDRAGAAVRGAAPREPAERAAGGGRARGGGVGGAVLPDAVHT